MKFEELRQLILEDQFKKCVSAEFKVHFDEQKLSNFQVVAALTDNYAWMHNKIGYSS